MLAFKLCINGVLPDPTTNANNTVLPINAKHMKYTSVGRPLIAHQTASRLLNQETWSQYWSDRMSSSKA
jgi:hypothetical protein